MPPPVVPSFDVLQSRKNDLYCLNYLILLEGDMGFKEGTIKRSYDRLCRRVPIGRFFYLGTGSVRCLPLCR